MAKSWVEILVDWLPMVVLVGLWLYFMKRSQRAYSATSGKSHGQLLEEHLEATRRQNELLEQLVRDQETRLQRLEAAVLGRS